jgi:hypothetical protein
MSSSSSTSRLHANEDTAVLFVAASLFEFNIDKARQEGGYPYLVYTQGEVFDVVAQKGELWLGKNQDDPTGRLGWLWEQVSLINSPECFEDIANNLPAFRCALSRLVSWRRVSTIDRLWPLASREEETIRQAEQSRRAGERQRR